MGEQWAVECRNGGIWEQRAADGRIQDVGSRMQDAEAVEYGNSGQQDTGMAECRNGRCRNGRMQEWQATGSRAWE